MDINALLYLIGLVIAASFILFSIDDIFFDLVYFLRRKKRPSEDKVPINKLESYPPKLLGILIAAWHEDNVLEAVIDHMLLTIQYPKSMYYIFLGVYPNDPKTKSIADKLAEKYANVKVVINAENGPTCKANNLNNMFRNIRVFEQEHNWRFASVTIHDSEDVIHPYELRITNYLIDKYDCLQFPVFPIQRKPRLNNIFAGMNSGTYADEFAENHFRGLIIREKMNGFVPSAGTGFVITKKIIDFYNDKPIFPEDTLTEDYKLSFIFEKLGFRNHYVLEKVVRLLDNGKTKWDYVATRSIFPNKFRTAVRQKTRWIYGITMQSTRFSEIFTTKNINFASRYTLYKDLKAKVGNLLILPAYFVFIYFIISLFISLPAIYPLFSLSWYLCLVLTIAMVFRQVLRGIAIYNVYGISSVFVSCLLPPLLPIRLIWGNIINMCATFNAWKQLLFGMKQRKKGKKETWKKTDHEFLSDVILYKYLRNTGDALLVRDSISIQELNEALLEAKNNNIRIGEALLKDKVITEEQLLTAVAEVQNRLFVADLSVFNHMTGSIYKEEVLRHNHVFPIFWLNKELTLAVSNDTQINDLEDIFDSEEIIHIVYATKEEILRAIDNIGQVSLSYTEEIERLIEKKAINWEQGVIALTNMRKHGDILLRLGLKARRMESNVL